MTDREKFTEEEKQKGRLLLTEKFVVRFPPELRHKIHQVANRCKRSVNKEILARLEHSVIYFPTVPSYLNNEFVRSDIEKSVDFITEPSPEAEIIVTHKLKEVLGVLDFNQKVSLLRFLQNIKGA